MPELYYFKSHRGAVAVSLDYDPQAMTEAWSRLRSIMIRNIPSQFTRDEWAYLITFLDRDNLIQPFQYTFGEPLEGVKHVMNLFRPRGAIAVWLPNNVSLLGPLTLVLLSLTGQPLQLKEGSGSDNLTRVFLDYARHHLDDGSLRDYLQQQVECLAMSRDDPRHEQMTGQAMVRIVFGSDMAAAAIHARPHPLESVGYSFVNRQSEAWIEPDAADDDVLNTLIRVFTIYGKAGCTSPRRVILLNANQSELTRFQQRLLEMWPLVQQNDQPMHVVSTNFAARQWAAALGWDACLTRRNGAMLAAGSIDLPVFDAPMGLCLVNATLQHAVDALPDNIQTIGHALNNARDPRWLDSLATTRVKRFVPLARMHHFGPLWDGEEFWRGCFETMELET